MLDSLNSGVSGLEAFQNSLDAIGNNIANSNTTGFKSSRTDFADALSQTLLSSGYTSGSTGTVGQQVGSGVTTASMQTLYTQGTLTNTGVQSDLAIQGEGFFQVKDTSSGTVYATRAGDFTVDPNGYLVTSNGMRLQGTPAGSTSIGDLQIAPPTGSTLTISGYSIASTGAITLNMSDGSSVAGGQIMTQNYSNPQALVSQGGNLYSVTAAAGPTTAKPSAPGSNSLGTISSGYLEMSNVDLASEFANLITAQRGFEANSKVITTSDQVLQTVVNLIR